MYYNYSRYLDGQNRTKVFGESTEVLDMEEIEAL